MSVSIQKKVLNTSLRSAAQPPIRRATDARRTRPPPSRCATEFGELPQPKEQQQSVDDVEIRLVE